jgi:hypothetical protein
VATIQGQVYQVVHTKGSKKVAIAKDAQLVKNMLQLDLTINPREVAEFKAVSMFRDLNAPGAQAYVSFGKKGTKLVYINRDNSESPEMFQIEDPSTDLKKSTHRNLHTLSELAFRDLVWRLF